MAYPVRKIDVVLLCRLWADPSITRQEVARQVGISCTRLYLLRQRYGLPDRPAADREAKDDPTPEQIAERARECRERHYAQRRGESEETTKKKLQQGAA